MRRIGTIAAIAALVFASLSVLSPPIATAAVPPATGNNAVISVKVGSDRTGTSGVTNLAGVTLGFYDAATGGTAAFTCVSDADGDCSITVPNTQGGGANRNRRFFVRQISTAPSYYMNPTLAVGTTVASTSYVFQTGNQLHNGQTYTSQQDFMISTGNNNDASGGIWQDSRNNPTLPVQCGLHVAIVADLSNSVGSDLVNLKGAATTMVGALTGTPSTVSLFTFATDSPAAGASNVNRPGLLPVSTAAGAATVNGFINGWTLPGGDAGGTNWDQAFAAVAQESQHYDVVVVITDGNPTFYGTAPVQGPGNRTRFREVENGIFSANAVKAENTRIIAMGVGAGIGGAPDNLRAISGPTLNSDYYQSSNYSAAGAALKALALGSCQGTVTVVKQVLPPGTPANSITGAQPAGGWTFGATTTGGVTVSPASGQTANGTGALNFNLTFPGGTTTAAVTLSETQQTGYTLHPVNGFNAVCIRVDTGAALPVTNVGTGFSVGAAQAYPVSCTVYNTAPQPPASVVVTKQWVVNGTTYPQGEQPPELSAALLLNGTAQNWGTPRTGFSAGDPVSIDETSGVAATSLCTITTRLLTSANGSPPVNQGLPNSQTLVAGLNTYQITNTATCPARLTLVKNVVNGPAAATAWTLNATAPSGALAGPSGTTGITAPVTPLVTYPLSESAGDPRYVQLQGAGAVAIPGSTISWFCNQVDPTTDAVIPGFSDGLNGGVTIPLGLAVRCEARNQTSPLTLIKQVINDNGGSAVPGAWNLTATPTNNPPAGLTAQTVPGSAPPGQTIFIRPGQQYALTESTVPGYTLDSIQCVIGDDTTPRAMTSVTLAVGQTGVCTYVNNDQPAHLTLVKTVTNDNGGTAVPTAWTLSATGPTPISGASGSASVTNAAVNAGTYALSEAGGPSGYTAGSWSCDAGTLTGSSLVLGVGVSATCTINNNDEPAHLTLVKTVANDNGGTATPEQWTLSASGPTNISGSTGSPAVTNAQVNAGTYALDESGPAGYAGTWSCTAGTLTGSSLVLGPGVSATCTITNNDQPAHLTLVKTVTNNNGGTATAGQWTLSASGPTNISGSTGSAGVTNAPVDAGTYTLAESDGPAGYTAGDWSCTGVALTGSSLVLEIGESATCTINNDDQPARLTLVKTVTNDNGGTATPTQWTLAASGPTPIRGATGSAGVTNVPIDAGTYTLAESGGPAGYTAGDWSCDGGTQNGSSLDLGVGQSATCTINNDDQPAQLTLKKIVDPAESGSGKVPFDWTLTATPDDIPGQGTVSGNGDPTSSGGVNKVEVFAGNYDLTESGPSGFRPGNWSCEGGTLTGAQVSVPSGGDVICTITNTAIAPHLTLVKVVHHGNTGATDPDTAWTLTATGPTPISGKTGDSDVTSAPVQVGTYTLSEDGPSGYTASDWTCTGATDSTGDSVTLAEGDDETCTITNTAIAPKLTLVKVVDNGETGGTATEADWTLTAVNGGSTISGTSGSGAVTGATAIVGTYTLSESGGPKGYEASTWDCGDTQSTNSTVTLSLGDEATCTITNTAIAPTLTLVKEVDPNGTNATANPENWTLTADGPTTISGTTGSDDVTGATAVAGTYNLSESDGPSGYEASDWTCTGATDSTATSVTLDVGQHATCTITNTAIPPTLTLVKVVDNGDTGGTATPQDWTLSAVSGSSTIAGTSGSDAVTGATAVVGTYNLSESGGPKGYVPSAWACTGATGSTDTTVTLQPGDEATCTITNTAVLPTLTLLKTVDNGDTGATAKPTDWTLTAVNGTSTITGTSGSAQVTDVPAIVGTYTLSETGGPDGYTASAWTCTGGTESTATSVTLSTADAATCTITNTAVPPTLTLVKTVDNDNTGATHTAKDWTLSATGPSEITGATGSSGVTAAVVKVGAYRLDESGPAGYTASAWTCTGAAETTASTVTVSTGQHATCRIANTAIDSKLTLVKRVQNLHGGTRQASDWTLYASGPMKLSGKTGAAGVTAVPVPMGAYDLNEGGPTGYSASAWTCTNATVAGSTVQIGLQQSVICTITNTDVKAAPPPPPTSPLATTGAAALSWTKTGLLLLLVGGVLTFLGRRRNRA